MTCPRKSTRLAIFSVFAVLALLVSCESPEHPADPDDSSPGSLTDPTVSSTDNTSFLPEQNTSGEDESSHSGDDCELFVGSTTFYEDNHPLRTPPKDGSQWEEVAPDVVGLDLAMLNEAAQEIDKITEDMLSILVARNGKLAFELYFDRGRRSSAENVHSASKSILSLAMGVAIDKGLLQLDQKVAEIVPDYFKNVSDARKKEITIRHLLTMSAGLAWNEGRSEKEIEKKPDWVQAIVDRRLVTAPGSAFNYSSGVTHLLSAALTQASKQSTCRFVHDNVFNKIGIRAERWGKDPQGIFSGGYNVYLSARELATLGQLVLNQGEWQGKDVISKTWVADATTHQIDDNDGDPYGYLFWLSDFTGQPSSWMWGFGGQFVFAIPAFDMVVVITTNTECNPEQRFCSDDDPNEEIVGPIEEIILKYMTPQL